MRLGRASKPIAQALAIGLAAAIVLPLALQLLPRPLKSRLRGDTTVSRGVFVEEDTLWDVRIGTNRISRVISWDAFDLTRDDEAAAYAREGLEEIESDSTSRRFWETGDMDARPVLRLELDTDNHTSGTIIESGWPARCAWDATLITPSRRASNPVASSRMRIVIPLWKRESIVLHYGVIWRGLAIDAAFWGLVFGGGWLTSRSVWRRARGALAIRRGRCPRCRYDLGGETEAGCPECGWRRRD